MNGKVGKLSRGKGKEEERVGRKKGNDVHVEMRWKRQKSTGNRAQKRRENREERYIEIEKDRRSARGRKIKQIEYYE